MYNVYLVKYQDINKDEAENIIIQVNENIGDIEPNIAQQIFEFLHPDEVYQNEISIITFNKLYSRHYNSLKKFNFLDIKGEKR